MQFGQQWPENKHFFSTDMLNVQRCSFLADHVNREEKGRHPPPTHTNIQPHGWAQPCTASSLLIHVIPNNPGLRKEHSNHSHWYSHDRNWPQSWPLTFMLVGHLLAARKVQTHQGAETEEKGEIQDKEDVFHGGDGGVWGAESLGPTSPCESGELEATSLPPNSRPLSSPRRKHRFFCRALSFPWPH